VENRPLNENRWHYTFPHRFFPDYFQSYGLGFFEFFQLAEELGADPLPILSCGLACQFQNNDPEAHVKVSELQPYIQDALDLVEFANGDTLTHWGALRAQMGHPAPFHLKYIGIGNEQWGPEYPERLKPFIDALRAAYPQIQIVGSSGPNSEGEQFDYLWPEMKRLKADLVDEHFYRPERWFLAQGNRYDKYDRKGPKVFAGEYACHGSGKKWNHFHASLMEAAFMTGLERNADVVRMATYAPLFAHVEGWQWRPDMIWFDNLRSVRTCSYYVQQLYSLHRGTHTLSLTMNRLPISGQTGQDGLFASAVWDAAQQSYILKVVNTSDEPQPFTLQLKGVKQEALQSEVETITLQALNPDEENTVEEPNRIVPQAGKASLTEGQLSTTIAPNTFTVYTIRRK
jgi:alpha-L-arabinofuranosidase